MSETVVISTIEDEGKDFADATEKILDATARELGKPFDGRKLQLRAEDGEGYREIGRLPAIGDAPQRIWFVKEFDQSGSAS